jgi:hypothetical protein
MSFRKNKIKALALIKELYNDKNSLSVTLTGSYSEHFDLDKAGDIDIIIICKKLDRIYFDNCIKKLIHIKKKYLVKKKS